MTTTTMSPLVEQQFRANAATTRKVLVDNMLVESEGFTQMQVLEEASKAAGTLIVEGLVGRCGVPTANKRFYGESIMRREVERLQERINVRSLLSAVDHPIDGKCLGKGTPVLLADGRVLPVEQIAIGDRLMGPDGEARTVLSTTTGQAPLYRIDPLKSDSFVCNGPHILSLIHTSTGDIIDISVDDYLTKGVYFKSRYKQFSVGIESFESPPAPPTVDPYFVGAWFGDGSKSNTDSISADERLRSVALTNLDPEVIACCEDIAHRYELRLHEVQKATTEASTYSLSGAKGQENRLLTAMRDLVGPDQKIPDCILRGSREVRLQFLAGFLDADGELNHNCFYVNQKRADWADAIYFIAKSLGFGATHGTRLARDQHGTEGLYNTVTVFGHVGQIPTRVSYKKAAEHQRQTDATRTGFSITPIGEGNYYGFELDGDGRFLLGDFAVTHNSRIREAGAICTGLRVESDGRVVGRYEIVEGSDGGRNLAAFLRQGASIGMSSRGLGSTSVSGEGYHVVGEDFRLHGFDFVADPACRDAFPGLVSEDVDPAEVDENQLRATFSSLVEQIEDRARQHGAQIAEEDVRARVEEEFKQALDEAGDKLRDDIKLQVEAEVREQLREDFAAKLMKALQEQRAEVASVVRSELLSDPSVAGAKQFMEELAQKLVPYRPRPDQQVVMDDYETKLDELREQCEQTEAALQAKDSVLNELAEEKKAAEAKAREFGYRLFVESAISKRADADRVRNMVGDVTMFESGEALRNHVAAVVASVDEAHYAAEDAAYKRLKIKEHKADLAREKASIQTEELYSLKEEMDRKFEGLQRRMANEISNRDSTLEQADEHIRRLERALQEAQANKTSADLHSYAVRRTVGHPRGADIMALVESGRVTSQEEVHQLAEQWDVQGSEPGGVHERIRRTLGRGAEAPAEREQQRAERLTEDQRTVFSDMNTTMAEMRALSGIGHDSNGRRF